MQEGAELESSLWVELTFVVGDNCWATWAPSGWGKLSFGFSESKFTLATWHLRQYGDGVADTVPDD